MKRKHVVLSGLVIATALALTGCIPGDGAASAADPAGFFWGIWHGWIAPLSLILSFFKHDYSIYEIHNSGFLYDLGFYIAVISGFGGVSTTRKKHKERKKD